MTRPVLPDDAGAGDAGHIADHNTLRDALAALYAEHAEGAQYQPLDSDLTAIAALSTTAFGRGLLALAAAVNLRAAAELPTTSTDNTLPRFDGTAGALQTSGLVVSDGNDLTVPGTLTAAVPTAAQMVGRLARTPNSATGDLGLPAYAGSDTGWRSLDLGANFTGKAQIRRVGYTVMFTFAVTCTITGNLDITAAGFATGFRPSGGTDGWVAGRAIKYGSMNFTDFRCVTSIAPTLLVGGTGAGSYFGEIHFTTTDAWPTTLPGTQVTPPAAWS